jgi:hypothetical protein
MMIVREKQKIKGGMTGWLGPVAFLIIVTTVVYFFYTIDSGRVLRDCIGPLPEPNTSATENMEAPVCTPANSAVVFLAYLVPGSTIEHYRSITQTLIPAAQSVRAVLPQDRAAIVLLCDEETRYLLVKDHTAPLFNKILALPPTQPKLSSAADTRQNMVHAARHVFDHWQCVIILDYDALVDEQADLHQLFDMLTHYDVVATFDQASVPGTRPWLRMIDTSVIAMRSTHVMRYVLSAWHTEYLKYEQMENADKRALTLLVWRYGARFWPLTSDWKCMCDDRFNHTLPLYVADGVLMSKMRVDSGDAVQSAFSVRRCRVVHGCEHPTHLRPI